jgi:flagellar biosynthesis protein FliP
MKLSKEVTSVAVNTTDFVMSPAEQKMYETWQDEQLQEDYKEQKAEWILEHGDGSLEEFEEEFAHFVSMYLQDDPD